MNITADDLKEVMRNWTSGVAIISSEYQGIYQGMTVNSFTSVSVQPPMVVVTLANNTRTCNLVKTSRVFGLTILSSSQKNVSDRFAGKVGEYENRFAGLTTFHLSSLCPLISDGLAWLDCVIFNEIDLGNSTLFIAEVIATMIGEGDPLLYHNRDYYRLGEKDG